MKLILEIRDMRYTVTTIDSDESFDDFLIACRKVAQFGKFDSFEIEEAFGGLDYTIETEVDTEPVRHKGNGYKDCPHFIHSCQRTNKHHKR